MNPEQIEKITKIAVEEMETASGTRAPSRVLVKKNPKSRRVKFDPSLTVGRFCHGIWNPSCLTHYHTNVKFNGELQHRWKSIPRHWYGDRVLLVRALIVVLVVLPVLISWALVRGLTSLCWHPPHPRTKLGKELEFIKSNSFEDHY